VPASYNPVLTNEQDAFKQVFYRGQPFVDVETNTATQGHQPPVLGVLCNAFAYETRLEKLTFLLDRGAEIDDRDHDGKSCLHYFVTGKLDPAFMDRDLAVLLLLLQRGADVHATDNQGESASEAVYTRSEDGNSYPGDLWDLALTICGYDVETFRRGRPRREIYDPSYTSKDFQKLWMGLHPLVPLPYLVSMSDWHDLRGQNTCKNENVNNGSSEPKYIPPISPLYERYSLTT